MLARTYTDHQANITLQTGISTVVQQEIPPDRNVQVRVASATGAHATVDEAVASAVGSVSSEMVSPIIFDAEA